MPTSNFNFLTLNGSDAAGHNTINDLIDSIDSTLNASTRLLPGGLSTTAGYTLVWSGGSLITSQINTAGITDGAVTYAKLNDNAKVYEPVTISSSSTLSVGTHDTTKSTTIPLVRVTAAATISIPTGGVVGSVINIFSTTSGTVTIAPVSSSVTINGSTSATYDVGSQYSIVSLICYDTDTWIIAGDFV